MRLGELFPHPSSIVDVDPSEMLIEGPDNDEDDEPAAVPLTEPTSEDVAASVVRDTGELYGVHVPPAADTELAPEDSATAGDPALGETWTEELRAKSSESGAVPEHEIDVIDETDDAHPHHATESGDRPVADKGSGGIGGL
ncbi:MAG TPA: hypothetical protein VMJ10_18170 [Kofleriaceae bacterium]|nr:hypothetical protein [Kofleriaceae bacterium]